MWETRRRQRFDLPVASGDARRACLAALSKLSWELAGEPGDRQLSAVQAHWRLSCCNDLPAAARISVIERQGGFSTIELGGSMTGRGTIQSVKLPQRLDSLQAQIEIEAG
jgi:hypothetical protein